jgi:hypothetical protein
LSLILPGQVRVGTQTTPHEPYREGTSENCRLRLRILHDCVLLKGPEGLPHTPTSSRAAQIFQSWALKKSHKKSKKSHKNCSIRLRILHDCVLLKGPEGLPHTPTSSRAAQIFQSLSLKKVKKKSQKNCSIRLRILHDRVLLKGPEGLQHDLHQQHKIGL